MPIWSLTLERLEKLRDQIVKKKAEYNTLYALSEKDLWCKDLDDFVEEWDVQAQLAAKVKKNIRGMNRRESKKIGAGGAGRGRKKKDDDDYAEAATKRRGPKSKKEKVVVQKVAPQPTKSQALQKFGERPTSREGTKPPTAKAHSSIARKLPKLDDSDLSEGDFAALGGPKALKAEDDDAGAIANGRGKRAAATKKKAWILDDDSESNDDGLLGEVDAMAKSESPEDDVPVVANAKSKRAARPAILDDDSEINEDSLIGDVAAMVKGIPASSSSNARLGLFTMSQSNGGPASLPKGLKSKPSRVFDEDSVDDTNYEMLARSSPHKTATQLDEDDMSSDDIPVVKPKAAAKSGGPASKAPLNAAKKTSRARPAAAASKTKEAAKAKPLAKPAGQSPAAKAYAAKKAAKQFDFSDDDDDDIQVVEPESPPPRPAGRGRAARTAATSKRKVAYFDDDDDEDEDEEMFDAPEDDESDDPFDMDED